MDAQALIHAALDAYEETRQAHVERALANRDSEPRAVCKMQFEELHKSVDKIIRVLEDNGKDGLISQFKLLVADMHHRRAIQEGRLAAWRRLVVMVTGAAIIAAGGWLAVAAVAYLRIGG